MIIVQLPRLTDIAYYTFSPSLFGVSLVITNYSHLILYLQLVFSIYDLTEEAIKKMIEANKRIINEQHNNRVVNEHFKLQIKTLQNAPRDPDKLKRLLRLKEREKDEAMYIQDTERLFTEIEMLRVVLYLVNRNNNKS